MCNTDTKQVSPFPDHEAVLLQVHQLQMDIEARQSQAVEIEETARKEIDELKLQVQECLLAREHEKNVSAVANPFSQTSWEKREVCRSPPVLSCMDNQKEVWFSPWGVFLGCKCHDVSPMFICIGFGTGGINEGLEQ